MRMSPAIQNQTGMKRITVNNTFSEGNPAFMVGFTEKQPQSIMNSRSFSSVRLFATFLLLFVIAASSLAQTTRYWVGGATGGFNVAANWSTALGGAGNGAPVNSDLLIIDGSDISSAAGLQTGAVTITGIVNRSLNRLSIVNSADVTLTAAANRTLTLGGAAGNDFIIDGTSSLVISTNTRIILADAASALIDGTLTVDASRTYATNNAGALTTVNGSIISRGIVDCTSASRLVFNDGSQFEFARDGGIALPLATWSTESTCLISGITTTSFTSITADPSFGNFIWDCPGQAGVRLFTTSNATFTITVKGDMEIRNTGGNTTSLTDGDNTKTLRIDGDLTIGDGTNVAIFNLKSGGSGTSVVNLGGNLTVNQNSTLTATDTDLGTVNFGYSGAIGKPSVTWGGSGTYTNTNINYVVQNNPTGKQVTLAGFNGNSTTIPAGRSVQVSSGATLNTSTQTISGAGTFNLNAGGILGIGHPNGLNANITTTTQTFNATSVGTTFLYNGVVAQITGTNLPATVSNLRINNALGVTLSGNHTVSEVLTMNNGNVTAGAFTLSLSNPIVGSLNHDSGWVIGRFQRAISTVPLTDYLFPLGTGSFYRPASFNFSSITAGTNITARFIESSLSGFASYTDGVISLDSPFTEGYWSISSSSLPSVDYDLTLTGNGFTSLPITETSRITGRDNSDPTWRGMGVHGSQSGNVLTRSGIATLNTTSVDFGFATGCSPALMGYLYERDISIDHTRVEGSSDLKNFPVMIKLTGEDFLKTPPTGFVLNPNGWDIIFTDANYNKLDHQIESYDPINGDFLAWVRIPILSASSNTLIKILYGNQQISSDPSSATVWDTHYKGVWHLNDSNLEDYSSFNKPGTPYNTPTYPAGQINSALGLNGGNQYAQVLNAPNTNFAGNITVSAWIYLNGLNLDQKIAGNQNNSSGGYKFGVFTDNRVEFEIRTAANQAFLNRSVTGGTTLAAGQWYYVAGVSSDVLDSIRTFVNGIAERPYRKTGTLGIASNDLTIGREPWTGSYYFNGRIDELRISDKVRSDGWLRTDYNNQVSPSTFYSIDGSDSNADYLPSVSLCNAPVTLNFGYPSGGTYSGNPFIFGNQFNPLTDGTFEITYTVNSGCGDVSTTKYIIVTPAPDAPDAPDAEYCTGTITLLEATSGENIRWYFGGLPVSTANPYSTGQTAPGTYNYTVTQTVNGCESAHTPVTLTIFSGTSITTQPVNTASCTGQNVTISIVASGPNLSYQWRKNGVNLSDVGTVSGSNSPNLTITGVVLGDAGNYTCVVTSTCGTPLTSSVAALTVAVTPTPAVAGNNVVCPFATGVIYNTTDVPGHTYLWEVSGGTIVGAATGNSISVNWDGPGTGWVRVTQTVTPGCSVTTPDYSVERTDITNPTILGCPSDINANNTPDQCSAIVTWIEPVATDNCTVIGNLVWTKSHSPGDTFGPGTTTVTYTVEDESGNLATCSFDVTVSDTQNPVISLPAPPTITADASCQAALPAIAATATDNCSLPVNIIITQNPVAGTLVSAGVTTVTVTATDEAGNFATTTIDVTVIDDLDPVITPPADVTLNLNASCEALVPNFLASLAVTDNCTPAGSLILSQLPAAGSTLSGLGTSTVTITATDASGNSSSVTVDVTTQDITDPVALCRDITVYLNGTGTFTITAADLNNGSYDNCSALLTLTASRTVFNCTDLGPAVPVTLTATDGSGNSANCIANVLVLDTVSPVVVTKTYTLVLDATGTGTLLPANVDNGSYDNCGPVTLSVAPDFFSCGDQGPQTVTLTATDPSGNSSSADVVITVATSLNINSMSLSNCELAAPFALYTADVTGGDGTYTYEWKGLEAGSEPFIEITGTFPFLVFSNTSSSETPFFNNLMPNGIYNIQLIVTDGNGCVDTSIYLLNKGAIVFNNVTTRFTQACDGETKTYTVNYDADATYNWGVENGTIITADLDTNSIQVHWNLSAPQGVVIATIQKLNLLGDLCESSVVDTVTINPVPTPLFDSPVTSACSGSEIVYTLTNTYTTHSWTVTGGVVIGGGTGGSNWIRVRWNSGPTGRVSVTVSNAATCTGSIYVDVLVYNLVGTITDLNNVSCNGAGDGSVTVEATTGTGLAPYQYSLDSGPFVASGTFTGLNIGNHTVRIQDALSCIFDVPFTITQPAILNGSVSSQTNVSCFSGNDGEVTITASGGTSPYEYSLDGGPFGGSNTIGGLTAGAHTVTIRDANLCTRNVNFNITQPTQLVGTISSQTNIDCFGNSTGSVTVSGSGGTANYLYSFEGGAFQASGTFSGLSVGSYTVTVQDANLCEVTVPVTITQPAAALAASTTTTAVLCFGDATGGVNLTVTGGTSPYTYLWSNGATTEDLAGVVAGTYNVTITDANGCTTTSSGIVTQPAAALAASTTTTAVLCFGDATGGVNLTVTGGTAPYTYLWSNGATTEDLTNVVAGTYNVTITDANGCTTTSSGTVTQPAAALAASTTTTPVLCFGDATGGVNLTVTGGTAPYTYLWSNGATTEDLTGVVAGTYNVTITDANGCTTTSSGTVTQPAAALAASTTTTTAVLCFGDATGGVNLTVTGGTAPYTYLWSNGATTEDLTNVVAGTYNVTITDANGCTTTASGTVTQPAAALAASTTTTAVLCFGDATGGVNLTVTGGTSPYTYLWSNGATTEDLTNVVAGTYNVTITDANGCTTTASGIVTQPAAALAASTTTTAVLCFGDATGGVNLTVTGGTAPYTYLWSNGATTEDLTNVVAGTYNVTITDANGCTTTASGTVTQPAAALAASTTTTAVLCFGDATGGVNLTVTGGTSPYTYLWSNGATTEDLTNVVAGTYNVTITDANGCTTTASGTVTQPAAALAASTTTTAVLCFGDATGGVNLTVTGGTSPYTYLWSNGATTEDLTNVIAGTYNVTITDANGCTTTASGTVTQPAAALAASTTTTAVLCFGDATGGVNLTVTGGTSPYTYLWSNGATTEDLTNVVAGTYNVTITDANGCTTTASGTVTQPAAALAGTTTTTAVLCFGDATGGVNLTVTGGTAPYTYLWSNGATTEDLTNVVAGTYNVTITDANGCTTTASGTVTQPAAALAGTTTTTAVLCFGDATGAVNLTVTGGTSPYSYMWSNGATTEDLTNVIAGTYNVTITDANGCTTTSSGTVTQPAAALAASTTTTAVLCFGDATGGVNLTVTGGTTPYTYLWSNGATTEDLTNVVAGTYNVTITDANGCTTTASGTVTQPAAALAGTTTTTAVLCFGDATGGVNLTVTGGTSPYTYLWSNGATTEDLTNVIAGTYNVTITDANGCTTTASGTVTQPAAALAGTTSVTNVLCFGDATGGVNLTVTGGTAPYTYLWSNGATTEDLTNVVAGTYNVTITDANGCTTTASGTVTQPAAALAASTTTTAVLCFGDATGGVNLTVTGGTAPYTYLWSNGATTEDLTNVIAGTYNVTITDANGCTTTSSGTVTQPAAALAASTTTTAVLCFGNATGGVDLTVTGGTSPYTYLWSNGATTEDLTNVIAGTYNVTISDANGCTTTASGIVTQPAAALAGTTTTTAVLCFGDATGGVNLTVTGGTAPYTYLWSNGATTEDLTNVIAGTYNVTITDANGCTTTASGIVTQPAAALAGTTTTTAVLCFGNATGGVNLTVTGGTSPYTYLWSNGATTEDLAGVVAGTYNVTITDANGCTTTASGTVTQPAAALAGTTTTTAVLCFGDATGGVNLTVTGGTAPYTYLWSNGATTEDLTNVIAGTYNVTITDANGCTTTASGTVTQPAAALAASTTTTAVLCFGDATGGVNLTVTGGTSPYTYLWSNGATTEDLAGVVAGTYNVTITDANGCTTTASGTVTQPAVALAGTTTTTAVLCFGDATGGVNLTVTGGTAPYTYLWSNGATTEDLTNVIAGTYNVTITDANGCTTTASGTVTQPAAALAASTTTTAVLCFGDATGGVNLTVTGGTAPYTYLWSNGATTEDLTGVVAGTYNVTITDANGCTTTSSGTVTQPAAALAASTTTTAVLCFGDATGGVNLTVTGGTAPYTYLWSNGATTEDLTNVVAGTYNVTITDANGCTTTSSGTVTQPAAALAASTTTTAVLCFGDATGGVNLTVTGGTAPYTYLWSNGATTEDLTNVVAGTYNVTITDANGCITTSSGTVTQPAAALAASTTTTAVLCFGDATGGVNLTVTGGTSPYTYLWSNGATTEDLTNVVAGTYNVTITDANGCTTTASGTVTQPAAALAASTTTTAVLCFGDATGGVNLTVTGGTSPYTYLWSNGATTEDLTNVIAGTYNVTITDANGCTTTASGTVTQPAAALAASTTTTAVLCFGDATGAVNLTVTGGTAPYTYLWSNGATTKDLTNVVAGTYNVTITDANGCTTTASGIVTQPAAALAASTTTTAVLCFGDATGGVNLTVTGGTSPYTYLWSNGATTEDLTNVIAGTYNVTITDANGCTTTSSGTVTQPAAALAASTTTTAVLCFGDATGGVNLTVTGGTAPYTYLWSNGATTEDLTNVVAGTYNVTITDANGCTTTASGTVTQPAAALAGTTTTTAVLCFGDATGGVNLTVTGGTSPYTYLWSNGATTEDLTNVIAGTYNVTITDANGCTTTASGTVTQPAAALAGTTSVTNVLCFGDATGGVNLTVTGGTAPYTYLWSNGATTEDITNVIAGTYNVTITDANGCTTTASGTVTQPAAALAGTTTTTAVLCFGDATGGVNLTVTGGTTPYTYLWSNGATTEDLTNVIAGTYNVTIADANGCTTISSGTVTQPAAALAASTTTTAVLCFGNATGGVDLTVTGGTAPYTYLWSNGATTEDLTNVVAGTYNVTITDANGCTTTASGIVTQPAAALAGTTTTTAVLCFGNATGGVNLTVTGGTSPYTYLWSNGATTEDLTNVIAGTYNVTITDANGCTTTASGTVTQPAAALAASTTTTAVLCFGDATGGVNLTVTGGTAPYTYLWSNGATTEDLAGVVAGTYNVTITDANGCTTTASGTVTQPAAALAASTTTTAVLCFGDATGGVNLTVTGGTAPYTYLWSNGATTEDLTNVVAGTYNVTITDANGCTTTASGTVTQPAAALAASTTTTAVLCFGDATGGVDLTVTGGTAPYTYLWSNGATTEDLTNVVTGTYNVTITDANGCTTTSSGIVTQPAAALAASTTTTAVLCFGDATGGVNLTVTGGTSPYTYLWSNGATTEDLTNVIAGTFNVTITDANGCTTTASGIVTQPAAALTGTASIAATIACNGGTATVTLTAAGGTGPYSYTFSGITNATGVFPGIFAGTAYNWSITDAALCAPVTGTLDVTQPAVLSVSTTQVNVAIFGQSTGTATAIPAGGTAPYTYSWNTTPVQTTATATGLAAGTYTVTLTDANSCTTSATVTITQPGSALTASITAQTNVLCNGEATGTATVTAAGGTAPYTYSWNSIPIQTGTTATDLAAGPYTVTVTDNVGATATATVTITEPTVISIATSSQTNVLCNGQSTGSVTILASGGTPSYQYRINAGAWQISDTFTGLAAGFYTVDVRDANNCTNTIFVTITQPATTLSGFINTQTNAVCNGDANGSVTVSGSGGTPGYQFSINGGTTYQLSGVFNGLAAGSYTVIVRDANLCTFNVNVTITQPAILTGTVSSVTHVLCFGQSTGSVTVTAAGGTSPYQYSLNGNPLQASGTFNALPAGNHMITVRDINGCTTPVNFTITQPAAPLAGAITSQTNVACFGGTTGIVTVTATGGTSAYEYRLGAGVYQPSGTFSSLAAGSYTVGIRDANGCLTTVNVTITQPAAALGGGIASQTNVACFGGNTGSVTVSGADGTAPYQYRLGAGAYQASGTFGGLTAGSYSVTVRDANLCTFVVPVTITQPAAALAVTIPSQTNILCFGGATGSATAAASGGTAPYNYSWNSTPVQTGATASGLTAGTYTVTVTDAAGCITTANVTITQPAAALTISISAQSNVLCFGGNTGSATAAASGGTTPYNYSWSTTPVQTGPTATGLIAGTYTVTVTDAGGCTANTTVTITQPATALGGSVTAQTNVSCFGGNNGTFTVTGSGGTGAYQYRLGVGAYQASGSFGPLPAGAYSVTVRDANLCTFSVPVTITQPTVLGASITSQTNVACFGGATGSVTVLASGGTTPYEYNIDGGPYQPAGTFNGLLAGSHTVNVRDANSCSFNIVVNITQPVSALSGSVISQTNVLCNGGSSGSVTVGGTGGTSPYEYSLDAATYQPVGTFSGLNAALHTITIRDANGCTYPVVVNITQPAAALSISTAKTDVSCFGGTNGTATATVTGGTPAYSYSWNTTPVQTGLTATNLAAGTYTVTVTDANGCISNANVIITQPAALLTGSATVTTLILCNGGTATVTLTAAGGTTAYSYTFNGVTNATGVFTGITAATGYAWSITDANGCGPITGTLDVTQPAAITASSAVTTAILCNGGTATVTITAAGGTAPLSYTFDGVTNATGIFTGITAGTGYAWSVTDANSCTPVTGTLDVTEPAAITGSASVTTAIACNGGTATVTLVAAGGTAPYSYTFDGVTNATGIFAGITAATGYAWSITDANSCAPATGTLDVTEPLAITGSASVTTAIACNGGTATVTLVAAGGTTPYSYTFNGVTNTTGIFTGITAATGYAWSITDVNSCTPATGTLDVTEPAAITASAAVTTAILCNAGTGTVTITAAGGTAPLSYTFDGVTNATGIFTGITAGTGYVWSVTDANSCTPATGTLDVTEPTAITASATVTTAILCNAGVGTVTITASGGTAPLSYTFDGVTNATGIFTGITAGAGYAWSVTDAASCTPVTGTLDVTEPAAITGSASVTTAIACNGGTATVTLVAAGGTTPYSYTFNGVTNTTGIFTGITAATGYAWSITDVNSCTPATGTLDVTEPATITASAAVTTAILCNAGTGTVTITAAGGTAPLSYTFDGVTNATGIFTGITAGTGYAWSVTDANSCTPATGTLDVTEPAAITASAAVTTAILCNAGTGTVTITATGGTAPLSYTFDGVTNATGIFTGITAGTGYAWSVTDANSCTPATGTLDVTEPAAITGSASVTTAISCNGGTATVTLAVAGGTAPYSYTFNGVTNATGIFTGITAATGYAWSITDANSCAPATGTLDVTEPLAITGSASVTTGITCNGGTATVTLIAAGGTTPYSYTFDGVTNATGIFTGITAATGYAWSITDVNSCTPATGTLDVTEPAAITASAAVTTAILCNAGTGTVTITAAGGTAPLSYTFDGVTNATGIFTGITAGTGYVWSVTDANSCTPATGTLDVTEPAAITGSASVTTAISCNGGTATVTLAVAGGTAPYSYTFNGVTNATGIFTGITAATGYAWSITDANSCAPATGTFDVTEPAILTVTTTQTNVALFGEATGTATAIPAGGTAPYGYSWDTTPVQTTETATGLVAGTYTVTVTDANGCTATATVTITEPPAPLTVTITSQTNILCYGDATGSATADASGGAAPYVYSWDTTPVQTGPTATGLVAGTYTVTVTDNIGAVGTGTVTITQPAAALALTSTWTDVLCTGAGNGTATVVATGGTAPYSYSWDSTPVQTTATATGLIPGTYTATVTDANGCVATINVTITEPALSLTVSVTAQTNVLCFGSSTGTATATASGGTAPYTYSWSSTPVQTASTATGLAAGAYTVTVTDANGCTSTDNVTITQPPTGVTIVTTQTNVLCNGGSDGTATATVTGGTAPYSYSWNTTPVQTTASATGLAAGSYIVTVTDADGCTNTQTVVIGEPQTLLLTTDVTDASCPGVTDATINLTITGGTAPFTIIWDDGTTSEDRSSISSGTFSVVVTDANGCSASATVTVGILGLDCLQMPDLFTPNDDGKNDVWRLINIELYPDAELIIFNRWGRRVYQTKNPSANPWDGKFRGRVLPTDSYHYVLDLKDGSLPRSGVVTLIR
jgi:gliding motility-associated-like protein